MHNIPSGIRIQPIYVRFRTPLSTVYQIDSYLHVYELQYLKTEFLLLFAKFVSAAFCSSLTMDINLIALSKYPRIVRIQDFLAKLAYLDMFPLFIVYLIMIAVIPKPWQRYTKPLELKTVC